MRLQDTEFQGVFIIENFNQLDNRGMFVKIFNEDQFIDSKLNMQLREVYYSVSQKDVIRGMHFQKPPYEHEKIVHVVRGSVVDVLLDLRKESDTYKKILEVPLKENEFKSLFIPKGIAHGFKSLEDNTMMIYQVSSGYHPDSDEGIAYDSIGYDWDIEHPIVSKRDTEFITLKEFVSPF